MPGLFNILRKVRRRQDGSVAVEFGIIALMFAVTSLGLLEFGRAMHVRNQLSYAVDFAVREVMLNPTISNTTLTATVRERFFGHNPTDLTVSMSTETNDGVSYRKFTMSYPMQLHVPLMAGNITLSATRLAPEL